MGFPEKEYKFDSPLAALERTSDGFSGRYCPLISGEWKIELNFFDADTGFELEVNGKPSRYDRTENGIAFCGDGGEGSPLQWKIKFTP